MVSQQNSISVLGHKNDLLDLFTTFVEGHLPLDSLTKIKEATKNTIIYVHLLS
jgi:hypothetical protein